MVSDEMHSLQRPCKRLLGDLARLLVFCNKGSGEKEGGGDQAAHM